MCVDWIQALRHTLLLGEKMIHRCLLLLLVKAHNSLNIHTTLSGPSASVSGKKIQCIFQPTWRSTVFPVFPFRCSPALLSSFTELFNISNGRKEQFNPGLRFHFLTCRLYPPFNTTPHPLVLFLIIKSTDYAMYITIPMKSQIKQYCFYSESPQCLVFFFPTVNEVYLCPPKEIRRRLGWMLL